VRAGGLERVSPDVRGVMIGSSDRYQARLVWLATLTSRVVPIRALRGSDEIPLGAAAT